MIKPLTIMCQTGQRNNQNLSHTHSFKRAAYLPFVVTIVLILAIATPMAMADGSVGQAHELPGLSNPVIRGLQGILGLNRLAAWIGAHEIKKEINKKVDGKVSVNLKPYSALDLTEGKAKALEIQGDDLVYDHAFFVDHFQLKTDKETPIWVDTHNGKIMRPVKAEVMIHLTEANLNRSFQSEPIKQKLQHIKVKLLGGKQILSLNQPKVAFYPQRLHFETVVRGQGTATDEALPLSFDTGLVPEKQTGGLQLKNLTVNPIPGIPDSELAKNFLTDVLQWVLNPKKLIPLKSLKVAVESVQLTKDGLTLYANILLAPTSASST